MEYQELFNLTKNFTILYVEDNENFREKTHEILRHFCINVDTASDGEDAYKKYLEYYKLNRKYYDIVITDITMPKMNGLDLTKKIYKDNEEQLLIVVSAYNSAEYLLEFVNIGIEHFLVKPFELKDIFEVMYNASIKLLSKQKTLFDTSSIRLDDTFFWDSKKLLLLKRGQEVKLTKKEILLMQLFIDNINKAISFEKIYNTLWSDKMHLASPHNLNPIISRLKKKLPDNVIKSIYGFGYRFGL